MTQNEMVEKLIKEHGYTKERAKKAINVYLNSPEGSVTNRFIANRLKASS